MYQLCPYCLDYYLKKKAIPFSSCIGSTESDTYSATYYRCINGHNWMQQIITTNSVIQEITIYPPVKPRRRIILRRNANANNPVYNSLGLTLREDPRI